MKSFLWNIVKLSLLTTLVLVLVLFFVPDKISESSILSALRDKHALLEKTTGPKIILVGGSNVSFGVNSKQLSDELGMPVINTGLHGGLGLEFMANDIKRFVNTGDLVVVLPEYEYFHTDNLYGEMELVSVLFDVDPGSKKLIGHQQWLHLLKYMPTYSARKLKNYVGSLFQKQNSPIDIYHRNSFNQSGDAYLHWDMPNQPYQHAARAKENEMIYPEAIAVLKDLNEYVKRKNARMLLFPPVIDSTSFGNKEKLISKIAGELKNNDLTFASEPLTYRYNDSLFFNSYYHLNKKGVDKRTEQLKMSLEHSLE